MANLLAFAGSNSSTSINFQLVSHTVDLIEGHEIRLLNMAHFPYPMYSADLEKSEGHPKELITLHKQISEVDGLVLSVNEHNSGPSAYFKNVLDWLSRVELKFLDTTKVFLMATSPGKRGASSSLEFSLKLLPRFGAEVVSSFSLPSYYDNFKPGKGIIDEPLQKAHQEELSVFLSALDQ